MLEKIKDFVVEHKKAVIAIAIVLVAFIIGAVVF